MSWLMPSGRGAQKRFETATTAIAQERHKKPSRVYVGACVIADLRIWISYADRVFPCQLQATDLRGGDMRCTLLLAAAWLAAGLLVVTACGGADEKNQYNLFNPTPADKMRSFSTDQPPSSGSHSR
jgi:hypothetical protein